MRRLPAILLVCVIGYSLIGPAVFSGASSDLPECCRRSGKHHCAMMDMDQATDATSSGPSIAALKARCPYFPKGGVLLPQSAPALLAAAGAQNSGAIVRELTVQSQAEAGYRVSLSRSHQKRGPPSPLA